MNNKNVLATMLIALASSWAMVPAAQASALSLTDSQVTVSASSSHAKKPRKARAAKKNKGNKAIGFYDGSAEDRKERDRRLMRECKGRPNSGACEGYTR